MKKNYRYVQIIDEIIEISGCPNDATRLFFNPAGNNIYTTSEVNGYSSIIDGATDLCKNLRMYNATLKLAFCHSSNHVYFVNMDNIVVVDDETQLLEQIPIYG